MYVQHFEQSVDQWSMVTNPARGQLNREKEKTFSRSNLRIWSRETGLTVPSRVILLILHVQAESGAYSRDSFHFSRQLPHIPSTAVGSVSSLSGPPQQQCTDGVHHRKFAGTGPVVLKVVRVTMGAAFSGFTMGHFFCASLFPHSPLLVWSGHV